MEDRAFRPRDLYLRLLIAFCLAVISWIGISCFPEPGSGEKESPIVRTALGAPEGYKNKSAGRKNDDGVAHFNLALSPFDRAQDSAPRAEQKGPRACLPAGQAGPWGSTS